MLIWNHEKISDNPRGETPVTMYAPAMFSLSKRDYGSMFCQCSVMLYVNLLLEVSGGVCSFLCVSKAER